MKRFTIISATSLGLVSSLAHAGDKPDAKILEALDTVPLVDVLECQKGDEGSLSSLRMVSEMNGKKKDKKTRKAEAAFEERLVYWNIILGVASEDELIAAKASAAQRAADRKEKLAAMSAIDQAVYLAERDYPCDDIFESAIEEYKKAK